MNEFTASLQGANIRITEDGLISAIDLVMLATGKGCDEAGLALRRVKENHFSSENFMFRTFPGKGSAKTKVITFQHAIELIMVLPGKFAKKTRARFANIYTRYLAGDPSLITEIRANAGSNSLISWLARASIQAQTESQQLESMKLLALV